MQHVEVEIQSQRLHFQISVSGIYMYTQTHTTHVYTCPALFQVYIIYTCTQCFNERWREERSKQSYMSYVLYVILTYADVAADRTGCIAQAVWDIIQAPH